jgi:hypothetical protein
MSDTKPSIPEALRASIRIIHTLLPTPYPVHHKPCMFKLQGIKVKKKS